MKLAIGLAISFAGDDPGLLLCECAFESQEPAIYHIPFVRWSHRNDCCIQGGQSNSTACSEPRAIGTSIIAIAHRGATQNWKVAVPSTRWKRLALLRNWELVCFICSTFFHCSFRHSYCGSAVRARAG